MPPRTKREIVSAFNRLVEKHGFDKTTVDMIVREAEISRATFYRYFKDKYEVMTYNYKNLIDANNNPETIQTLEDLFVIFLESGDTLWRPIAGLFDTHGINSLREFIYDYSFEYAKEALTRIYGPDALSDKEKLQMKFFCQGASLFYRDWIRGVYGDMTPAEGAHAIYEILPEIAKVNLWETKYDEGQPT